MKYRNVFNQNLFRYIFDTSLRHDQKQSLIFQFCLHFLLLYTTYTYTHIHNTYKFIGYCSSFTGLFFYKLLLLIREMFCYLNFFYSLCLCAKCHTLKICDSVSLFFPNLEPLSFV